jgi:DNA-binding CsgD family transcriptional regulator
MVESNPPEFSTAAAAFVMQATVCRTIQALDEQFLRFAQGFGFESAMFVHLSSGGAAIAPRVVFGDCNPWIEHYAAENYARLDPTISRAFRSRQAFTWKDAERRNASRRERQFFGEAREVWAHDGLIVPVHGPFGEFSVVNLLSDRRIKLAPDAVEMLRGVCNIYANVGLTLVLGARPEPMAPAPALTDREGQCVYWMSVGKRDRETGSILGISAGTVREYIDSAKIKLGAETRPELSLRALACGLLVPDRCMIT